MHSYFLMCSCSRVLVQYPSTPRSKKKLEHKNFSRQIFYAVLVHCVVCCFQVTLQLRPRRISAGLHLDLGVSTNFEWKMANVDSGRTAETHSMESFSEHSGSLPSSQHEERQKVVGPLDWEGPNDPANPWNWPVSKRWYGTLVPGSLCFLV